MQSRDRFTGQDRFAELANCFAESRNGFWDHNQSVESRDRLSNIDVVAGVSHQSQTRCLARFSSGVTAASTPVSRPIRGSEHQEPYLSLDMAQAPAQACRDTGLNDQPLRHH